MPSTGRGFPYPASTDSPNGPAQIQALAEAVQAEFDSALTLGGNLTVPGTLTLGPAAINMIPLAATKTADESVVSSVTLQNDDHLVVAIPAVTRTWWLEMVLLIDAGQTPDFKSEWTGPAGGTVKLGWLGDSIGNTGSSSDLSHGVQTAYTDTVTFGGFGVGTTRPIRVGGVFKNAGTAGNLQLRWAQNTSNAAATKLLQHSSLCLIPIL